MKILVIGGTGKVGSVLVKKLCDAGCSVRVLTRSAERAAALPATVEAVVADLANAPKESAAAFDAVDTVFMLNQPTPSEVAEGLFAVHLATGAGVKRFVYQSAFHIEEVAYLPHLAPKLVIQRAVQNSPMEWTIIAPNNFFQNDLTGRAALEKNVYGQPVGMVGCSSVDIEDIASAAFIALTRPGHHGKFYNVVGPQVLTVAECAKVWSEVLGRDIGYDDDVDAWQRTVAPYMPAWLNYDLGLMYRDFGIRGYIADPGDVERLTELLGRPPRRYENFVRELAQAWSLI